MSGNQTLTIDIPYPSDYYYADNYDYFDNYTLGEMECDKKTMRIYTLLILLPGIMGIIGNTISAVILHQQSNKNGSANVMVLLLKILAYADNSYVLAYIIIMHLTYYFMYEMQSISNAYYVFSIVSEPILFFIATCAIWMTVIIAFVRYVAVCHPFLTQRLCNKTNIWMVISMVMITAAIFHIPWFFTYKIVKDSFNDQQWMLQETKLLQSKLYIFGYRTVFMDILVRGLLPMLILGYCNVRLLYTVYRQPCIDALAMAATNNNMHQSQMKEAKNVTKVIVSIISVYIISYFPGTINAIAQEINPKLSKLKCGTPGYYLTFAFDALLVMNSCVNFIIYYVIRKSFRNNFKGLFCRCFYTDERML